MDANSLMAFAGKAPVDDEMMEEEVVVEESGPVEGDIEKYARLIPMLEEYSEDVMALAEEMDVDVLMDPSVALEADDMAILQQGVDTLDRKLKAEMESCCGGISMEDAEYLAGHLEGEGLIDDAPRVKGWIYRTGELIGGGGEEMPAEEISEEMEMGMEEEMPEEM